jgi:hypothetical protein
VRDGHYGLSNKEVRRAPAGGNFIAALSYLIEDESNAHYVIHIQTRGGYLGELTSERFLESLGYQHFRGCPLLSGDCYYRYALGGPIDRGNWDPFAQEVEYVQRQFDALVQYLPEVYETVHGIYQKLGHLPDLFPSLRGYGPQALPDFSQDVPNWIESAKVDDHRKVEAALREAQERDKRFKTVEYTLWGTGDDLESAVHVVLEDLGFQVTRTPKGATVDRVAGLPDSTARFGLEITGLNEAIKKKSNKIGQALHFLQQREGSEKAVIVANTFKDRPLQGRGKEPDFTEDALDLMRPLGIVAMTTLSLYEIWKAVKYEGADIKSIAQDLYNHPGGEFKFPSP